MKYLFSNIVLIIATLFCTNTFAQKDTTTKLEDVVITATRTPRKLGNVAVPVSIVSSKIIKQTGSLNLQNILQEQTGIIAVNSALGTNLAGYPNPFGQGIQMQGLDPAYTAILLDGEPLVGRNGGVLKLGRLAIGNIKQIEIVKGPSSSLYGSEAMAGVINIITENIAKAKADVQLHSSSNSTYAQTFSYSNTYQQTGVNFFVNHYSTQGYDLDEKIYGKTVEPYREWNGMFKLTHNFSQNSQLLATFRLYDNKQDNNYQIQPAGQSYLSVAKGFTNEKDLTAFAQWKLSYNNNHHKIFTRLFFDKYTNTAFVNNESTGVQYDEMNSQSTIVKPEIQYESDVRKNVKYVAGIGSYFETINATRYDGSHNLTTLYAFTQEEINTLNNKIKCIVGARLDKRNDFAANINPRIAVAYIPNTKWKFTAAVGKGFKAPDFRHIYLAFTNQQIGYSLIGNNILYSQLQQLQQSGQISNSTNIDNYKNTPNLLPEQLWGFNVTTQYTTNKCQMAIDIFRNDVKNLIDFYLLPFNKNNGSNIYSYHNINRIFTQGVTIDAKYNATKNITFQAGYQYLEAKDKDVLQAIKNGSLYKRDPVTYQLSLTTKSDYFGLNNRSKHTANFKINYATLNNKFSAYVRLVYRGKYGYTDINGNGVADDDREMVQGFLMANVAVATHILPQLHVQAGIENLFNYTNAVQQPNLSGQVFFINLNYSIFK